jgi:hypothetical protein
MIAAAALTGASKQSRKQDPRPARLVWQPSGLMQSLEFRSTLFER